MWGRGWWGSRDEREKSEDPIFWYGAQSLDEQGNGVGRGVCWGNIIVQWNKVELNGKDVGVVG